MNEKQTILHSGLSKRIYFDYSTNCCNFASSYTFFNGAFNLFLKEILLLNFSMLRFVLHYSLVSAGLTFLLAYFLSFISSFVILLCSRSFYFVGERWWWRDIGYIRRVSCMYGWALWNSTRAFLKVVRANAAQCMLKWPWHPSLSILLYRSSILLKAIRIGSKIACEPKRRIMSQVLKTIFLETSSRQDRQKPVIC